MIRGLEVMGHLSLMAGDQPIRVDFRGDVVAVELAGVRTALALRRRLTRAERIQWLDRTRALLERSGLELQLWVGSRMVGRMTGASRPRWASRLLGLGPVELNLGRFLSRRRPEDPEENGIAP